MSNRRTVEQLTERERLELAAKAAGYSVKWCKARERMEFWHDNGGAGVFQGEWNPLDDDGAALRLALAAGIGIGINADRVVWNTGRQILSFVVRDGSTDPVGTLLRLAIFRAAVEIGLRMTPDLPAGFRMIDGEVHAVCCCCEQWKPLPVGLDEIGDPEDYQHHCGGSPRCCP